MKKLIVAAASLLSSFSFAFPLTVTHKFGDITLEQKPVRVVSVGYSDQDDILALGVKPVGLRDWYGNQPFATWPWAQDELGDAEPEIIGLSELDYEAITALKPDVIIGISSGMDEDTYNKLSAIAPTLAQSGDYIEYGTPWDVRHVTIGEVLGEKAKAQANVDRLNKRIDEVAKQNPSFKGKSAAVAFFWSGQPGVYSSNDLRPRFLQQLGFVTPAEYDELAGEAFYASFSIERLDLLNQDLVIWLSGGDALKDADQVPLRQQMPFFKEGREVFVGDVLGGAFSFFSPLSIDYLLDELIPQIQNAADGDPATQVK